jgi:4-hydroxy-2-oxoheptanedioate aldolase
MDAAASFSHAGQTKTEPIVRMKGHDTVNMKKLLDAMRLPGGVLVPMVEDAETAREIVQSTRYPPQVTDDRESSVAGGVRGCAVPFTRASGWGRNTDYMRQAQEDLLVMVQVETPQGIDAISEIANVKGIDGIFLGPLDLSCSIGKMGQFDDPEVQELIAEAENAVLKSNAFLAGFLYKGRNLKDMFADKGYSLVCGSVDLGLLREAARQDAEVANKAKGL